MYTNTPGWREGSDNYSVFLKKTTHSSTLAMAQTLTVQSSLSHQPLNHNTSHKNSWGGFDFFVLFPVVNLEPSIMLKHDSIYRLVMHNFLSFICLYDA